MVISTEEEEKSSFSKAVLLPSHSACLVLQLLVNGKRMLNNAKTEAMEGRKSILKERRSNYGESV
mgnify:CR=1 FL=1